MLNLTPHPITFQIDGRDPVTLPPTGMVARVETTERPAGAVTVNEAGLIGNVPVIRREMGQVTGLPHDDTIPVIVSSIVLAALPGRYNTFAPDTGPTAIRNEAGHIVAVTRLVAA